MNSSNISSGNSSLGYFCKYWEPEYELETNAKDIAVMILCVFGILNNIFIIVLAVKYNVRKNLHHLIINMAVSDGLYLASALWYQFRARYRIESLYPGGVLGDVLCKIQYYVLYTSYKVSLLILLVISFERFKATRETLQRPRPYNRVAVVSACWIVPMVSSGDVLYNAILDDVLKSCSFILSWEKVKIYVAILYLANAIAIVIIITLSIITIRRLSRTQPIEAHLNNQQLKIRTHRTTSAVLMVLVSALLFACCWFPMFVGFGVTYVVTDFTSHCIDWNSFGYMIRVFLPPLNACLSPFVYIIFLPDFREATRRVFCSCHSRIVTTIHQAPNNELSLSLQQSIRRTNQEPGLLDLRNTNCSI